MFVTDVGWRSASLMYQKKKSQRFASPGKNILKTSAWVGEFEKSSSIFSLVSNNIAC